MIGMIQMSTPRQRTFCEVIGQKLLVDMLAMIHSPALRELALNDVLVVRDFTAERPDIVVRLG